MKPPRLGTLERAIALVSPRWAMDRARSRAALGLILRHYEGASISRRTARWKTPSTSGNAAVIPAAQRLRDRARDLGRNNPWGKRACRVVAANTIGTGITPKPTRESESRLANAVAIWQDWGETAACDADGQHDFYGLEDLAQRTICESGEVLVRRRRRLTSDSLPIPIQLQVLEPDFLDESKDGVDANGNRVVGGVAFNAFGQREGYWIFDEHPGDGGGGGYGQSTFVPASDIRHSYWVDRPGQVRGVPWLAPVLIRLRELDEYEDAQLLRQKIAACFAAFRQDAELPEEPPDPLIGPDGEALEREADVETLEPGTIEDLPPGKTITFANPPTVSDFEPFTRAHLRAVAVSVGITYEALTGDMSQANFSQARMGWLEMSRHLEDNRWKMLFPQLIAPAWSWFTAAGELAGYSTMDVGATWTAPRREMIDPVKETNARKAQVRSGFISLSESIRQEGFDPEEVLPELAEDLDFARELGLALDVDGTVSAAAGAAAQVEVSAGS